MMYVVHIIDHIHHKLIEPKKSNLLIFRNRGSTILFFRAPLICALMTHVKKSKKINIPLNFVHSIH